MVRPEADVEHEMGGVVVGIWTLFEDYIGARKGARPHVRRRARRRGQPLRRARLAARGPRRRADGSALSYCTITLRMDLK